jgi:hypothetical protein
VHLACELIASNIVRKNHPTQVTRFVVDLAGKCVEGMQMNWVSYLINELKKYCRKAQDQGYEFHFSWMIVLISFITWKMPEGCNLCKMKPARCLNKLKDKARNWTKWLRQWNNAWKGLLQRR